MSEPESLADMAEKRKQMIIDIQSKVADRAAAYTNLILIGGYAGAFTIWNNIKGSLPAKANIAVAISLGLSLTIFIAFEVLKMISNSRTFMKTRALIVQESSPEEFFEKLKAAAAAENRRVVVLIPVWILTLGACIATALAGIGILFYNSIAALVGWPMWPT